MSKYCPLVWCALLFLASTAFAATFPVSNTAATGPGTLRNAINDANGHPGPDQVSVDVTGVIVLGTPIAVQEDVVITGPGAGSLTVSGARQTRLFEVAAGTLALYGLTLADGAAEGPGGAVTITADAHAIFQDCVFTNNQAGNGNGGAIRSEGNLYINQCTFVGNQAAAGGALESLGEMAIINSTFIDNEAQEQAGALRVQSGSIIHATIARNRSNQGGSSSVAGAGIVRIAGTSPLILFNTIVALNAAQGGFGGDISGEVNSFSSGNLIGENGGLTGISNGVNGNRIGNNDSPIDPLLGPLQDNGGSTPTLALLPLSLAIDRGTNIVAVSFDQRGVSRPQGMDPDVGAFEVAAGLAINAQPQGTNVAAGTTVTFCVEASGAPTLEYQWRKNGVNINGQTNSCLTITEAQASDGGSYSVLVASTQEVVTSDPAVLIVDVPSPRAGDDFIDRGVFVNGEGVISGTNSFASSEIGERNHALKPGGKSIWYRWVAPASGAATFNTAGSTFDTLLAIYRGTGLENLEVVAEDEDSGGFLSSRVRFNVDMGVEYQIAVDGYAGESGRYVVTWNLEQGLGVIATIVAGPQSATVGQGSDHMFTVIASDGGFTYSWFVNGVLRPGATESTLTITNVQTSDLGEYVARVHSTNGFVDSAPASLQINLTGIDVQPVLGMDKFQDAVNDSNPIRLGDGGGGILIGQGGAGLSRGYSGTHTFNTFGSKSQVGEPNHCGVVGGASQWFTFQAEEAGVLFVNTDGSSFDTLLAIYTGNGTSFASLQELACDNNHGLDGIDSSTNAAVVPGTIYFIVVDGVKAATGFMTLNYALVTPSKLALVGFNNQAQPMLRVTGRAQMRFRLEGSSDFVTWLELINTTSPTAVFNFTDPTAAAAGRRFYRARMLP